MEPKHTLITGKDIPAIGFGTWTIPEDAAAAAVKAAIKTGYRLIDTAYMYRNEVGVGKGVKDSGVSREELFVTTKLSNSHQGYDEALRSGEQSLKSLGLDYLDLYLIHWPVINKRQDSWRALEKLFFDGLTKAIGVSNYTVRHLTELLNTGEVMPAVNQVEFHPFIFDEQQELLELCQKEGIVLEAYSPLARAERLDDPLLNAIAKKHQKTSAQVVLRWCTQMGAVPIPKSTHQKRMKENIDIFDFELSNKEVKDICGLGQGFRTCPDPNLMP